MMLRVAEIAPDGTIRNEQELDGRACDCCQTAMVATAEGLLVAYRDRSPDEIRDISLVRQEGAGWSAPYPLAADQWKILGCPVNGPALDASGRQVAAAWFTAASDSPRVLASFSADAGRSFSAPIRVDEGQPLGRVGIALTDSGDALVTWLEGGTSGAARIVVRLARRDGSTGRANTVVQTGSARASGFPQIARAGDDVYFAWTETGKRMQVRVARAARETLMR